MVETRVDPAFGRAIVNVLLHHGRLAVVLVVGIGEVEAVVEIDGQVVRLVEVLPVDFAAQHAFGLGADVEGHDAVGRPFAHVQLAPGVEHHADGVGAVVDEQDRRLADFPVVDRIVFSVGEVDVPLRGRRPGLR